MYYTFQNAHVNKIEMKLCFRRTVYYLLGNRSIRYFHFYKISLVPREKTVQSLTYWIKIAMPLDS